MIDPPADNILQNLYWASQIYTKREKGINKKSPAFLGQDMMLRQIDV
jgi:hypothetical protein